MIVPLLEAVAAFPDGSKRTVELEDQDSPEFVLASVPQQLLPLPTPCPVPCPGLVDIFPEDWPSRIVAERSKHKELGFGVLVLIVGADPSVEGDVHVPIMDHIIRLCKYLIIMSSNLLTWRSACAIL